MGLASMGVRTALRTIQDNPPQPAPPAGNNSPQPAPHVGGPSTNDVAVVHALEGPDGKVTGQPVVATETDKAASALESIATWVPSETLTLWIAITTASNLFTDTVAELIVGGSLVLASGVVVFVSSLGAHKRRDTSNKPKAVKAGVVGGVAFFIYWMAVPGSIATDEWAWHPAIPSLIVGLALIFLPMLASALELDIKKKPS